MSSNSSANGGIENRPLSEIIYLDIERLSSYLSQLEDGLKEYEQKFEGKGKAETGQSWGFGLGGPSPLNFNWGAGNTAGADATVVIEQKRRHHAALHILERVLKNEGLVGAIDEGKPFMHFSEHGRLLDYDALTAVYRDFTELRYSATYVGEHETQKVLREAQRGLGHNALKTYDQRIKDEQKKEAAEREREQKYYNHYAHVLGQYAGHLDVFFPDVELIGSIEERYLLVPKKRFGAFYGSPTRKKLTVLALDSDGSPAVKLLVAPDELERSDEESAALRYVAAFLSQGLDESIGEALNRSFMRPIIPIALYINLEAEFAPSLP